MSENPLLPQKQDWWISIKKTVYLFGICAVVISLTGCKPKQTTINGQIFIATTSRENVRLGAVQVLLIEKQKATNSLQNCLEATTQAEKTKMLAEIDNYKKRLDDAKLTIKTCQINVTNEQRYVEAAQTQFNQAKEKYDQYVASQPLRTNAVYVKIYRDLILQTESIADQQAAIQHLQQEVNTTSQPGTPTYVQDTGKTPHGYWVQPNETARIGLNQASKIYLANAENDLAATYAQIKRDREELVKIVHDVNEFQATKFDKAERFLNEAQRRLTIARSTLDSARLRLQSYENNLPTVHTPTFAEIFASFMPPVITKTETDANGNFSLTYPRNKKYTLFARAERATPSDVEKYFWLIDAPSTDKTAPVLLDNNNLVEIDPNGYMPNLSALRITP